jgi:hypothetical protein
MMRAPLKSSSPASNFGSIGHCGGEDILRIKSAVYMLGECDFHLIRRSRILIGLKASMKREDQDFEGDAAFDPARWIAAAA